jgi:tetratricopeptide (TPR) repeat protein
MRATVSILALSLVLLLVACFGLAARLEYSRPWRMDIGGKSPSALALLMGESRRLFANHLVAKADAYFHSGYYPSIFDTARKEEKTHIEAATTVPPAPADPAHPGGKEEGHEHEHESEEGFLGEPRDWIDRFGRNFFPTEHSHLANGEEKEMLPWLRIAAELDPQKVEIYTVSAYWLRTRLNKIDEAEEFLREGWRANPESFEILFELGRVFDENRHDSARARNVWELALRKWRDKAVAGANPDPFACEQILGFLAYVEERDGNLAKAIEYRQQLKQVSTLKDELQKQIDEMKSRLPSNPK